MRNNLSLKVGKLKKKWYEKRKLKESKDELDPVFSLVLMLMNSRPNEAPC